MPKAPCGTTLPIPIGELRRMMEVRRVALERFGQGALPAGEPLAQLRRAFVPIWLLDRYQIEAAAKSVGGVNFPYALNWRSGGGAAGAGDDAMGGALRFARYPGPGRADRCPIALLPLLSGGFGGNDDRQTQIEIIPTAGGPVFDPLKATEVGAVQTLTPLLAPERLNRLEAQHAADASGPGAGAAVRSAARSDPGAAGQRRRPANRDDRRSLRSPACNGMLLLSPTIAL